MKFGKYLEAKQRPEWRAHYLDYKGLKDLIKEAVAETERSGTTTFSPRTTSLSVLRAGSLKPAEERFFEKLEDEVRDGFPLRAVGECRMHPMLAAVANTLLRNTLQYKVYLDWSTTEEEVQGILTLRALTMALLLHKYTLAVLKGVSKCFSVHMQSWKLLGALHWCRWARSTSSLSTTSARSRRG